MDDDARALIHHPGQEMPVEPHRRHEIEGNLPVPLRIGKGGKAAQEPVDAGAFLRPTNLIPTEPMGAWTRVGSNLACCAVRAAQMGHIGQMAPGGLYLS